MKISGAATAAVEAGDYLLGRVCVCVKNYFFRFFPEFMTDTSYILTQKWLTFCADRIQDAENEWLNFCNFHTSHFLSVVSAHLMWYIRRGMQLVY